MLLQDTTRNAMADAAQTQIDGGSVEIQDSGDVVLVTFALHTTAALSPPAPARVLTH